MVLANAGASRETYIQRNRVDLPSLASHAAIELDNLIRGQEIQLEAVPRLASLISDTIPPIEGLPAPTSLLDPMTVVVMNRAITDSKMAGTMTTVLELVQEAGKIGAYLKRVNEDPQRFGKENVELLEQMRAFCLALSKRASAHRKSIEDVKPPHPFRR